MEYEKNVEQNESCKNKEKENMSDGEKSLLEQAKNAGKDSNTIQNLSNVDNSNTFEDILKNCSWEKDQLAWARMSIYPFWPCMVTFDPSSFMSYKKVQTLGKSKTLMVHVHFFNDNGRHCWVPSHHMIPFKGIEDFRKRASLVTDEIHKKEPKFAAALFVKASIFKTWQKAVAEAMDVLDELDLSPLESFKPQLKDMTNNVQKNSNTNLKRKRKEGDDKNVKKIFKPNDSEHKIKTNPILNKTENNKIVDNINLETPPVSPPNEDDLRASALQKQKRITKMINKLQPPDFEVYFERNFFTIKEQHQDTTDEQVREYLYDVWEHMAPEEKQKYRATYKIVNDS